MSQTNRRIDEDYERMNIKLLRNKEAIINKYGETYYLQLFNCLETILLSYNDMVKTKGPLPYGDNNILMSINHLEIEINNVLRTLNDESELKDYHIELKNIEDNFEKDPTKTLAELTNFISEFESKLSEFLPINRITLRNEIITLLSNLIEIIINQNIDIDLHKFLSELPAIYVEKLIFHKEQKDGTRIDIQDEDNIKALLESFGIKEKEEVNPKKYIEIIDDILFKMSNQLHADLFKSSRIKLEKLLIVALKLITKLPYIDGMNYLNKVTKKYIYCKGKYSIKNDLMIEDQDIEIPTIILKIIIMHINSLDEKEFTNGLYLYQFGTIHPEFIRPKIFQSDKSILPKSENLSLHGHSLLQVVRIIDKILEQESLIDIKVRQDNRNKPFNKSSYDSIAFSPVNWEKFTNEILNKLYPKLRLLAEIYQKKGTFEKEIQINWSELEQLIPETQPSTNNPHINSNYHNFIYNDKLPKKRK